MVEDSYKVVKAIEFKRIKTFKEENETTEEQHDCLTSLPRPLLHHILSYLTMKDVIGTCVLAKRWRYIWLSVPCLKFSPMKMRRDREVSFINRTLLLHNGPSIQKFDLTLRHHRAATNVIDSWIYFAQTRNVNELYLGFLSNSKPRLPHSIFSCRSLSVLALKSCFVGSPVTFSLSSLKILSLELVDFSDGAINDLVRSSPMLEYLSLTNCQDGKDIDLDVQNVGMKTLKIHDGSDGFSSSSKLEVYAPFVVSFELVTNFRRENYVIKRMQSLESASFGCNASYHSDWNCLKGKEHSVAKILAGLCHVKELRLSSCYIEPLSHREEQSLDCTLFFNATCLAIKTGLTKRDLPRIGYMLRHSPNIKSLIVNIDEIQGNKGTYNLEEGEYWGLQEPIFVDMLCNLKDVKIYNFMKNLESKSMSGIEDFLACLQNDLNFLRFLLKNSKVMERMTITTFKNVKFGRNSKTKKLKLLFQLTQELLAFPGASRAAQISFS